MPSAQVFAAQAQEYQDAVLPPGVTRRLAIEAGVPALWARWVGPRGRVVAMNGYGESAPAGKLFEHFGFTADNLVKIAVEMLA
jgi:transketolase